MTDTAPTPGVITSPVDLTDEQAQELRRQWQAQHPARWSASVLAEMQFLIDTEAERQGRPLVVLDPFAGIGRARLADALGASAGAVVGVELQPEWAADDDGTVQGDATDLRADWAQWFDCVVTSPTFGNRMADSHDARDTCKACDGSGLDAPPDAVFPPGEGPGVCRTCKGHGVSWRNTYAHALRRAGGDLQPGSAAGLQWGRGYRRLHQEAISEMLRVTKPQGLLLVNMSNHVRDGAEQLVVEWWVNELLVRGCSIVEVRRVPTPRQGYGANGGVRIDGEVIIAMRTPAEHGML